MRKNKTMRGGGWSMPGYVTKDEFVNTGLRFAKDALLRYPLGETWPQKFRKPREPNVVSEFAVGQYYTEFYNKKRPDTVETYEYTKNNFMSNLTNQKRKKPVLTPDDFKEVYNYISNPESKGENKNTGVSTSRNQKYIDFLASFLAFAQGDEQLNTVIPKPTALQGEITARLAGTKVANTLQSFVSNPSVQQGLTQFAQKGIDASKSSNSENKALAKSFGLATRLAPTVINAAVSNPEKAIKRANTAVNFLNYLSKIPK